MPRNPTMLVALLVAGWMAGWPPAWGQDDGLPSETKPLQDPVELKFKAINHFIYSWSTVWEVGGKKRLIEAWAMEGKSEGEGDKLVWDYILYNIGHDGKPRETGHVRAVTEVWGEVSEVTILSSQLPAVSETNRPRLYDMLEKDVTRFWFPPCCLPHEALAMNAPFRRPGAPADSPLHSVVVGVMERDAACHLVVKHTGVVAGTEGASRGKTEGYSQIDCATGLTTNSVVRTTMSAEGGDPIVSVQRIYAEY